MANFAALEARSVAAVFKHLANGKAVLLDTGVEVPVIFDNTPLIGLGDAFETSQPSVLGTSADLSGIEHGSLLTLLKPLGMVGSDTWAVVGIQPDGTGLTRLVLERTA